MAKTIDDKLIYKKIYKILNSFIDIDEYYLINDLEWLLKKFQKLYNIK